MKVPDFVDMGIQSTQDAAQEKGFYSLKSHDSTGRDRFQALDRNWKVCSQNTAPGKVIPTDTTLDFSAVKLEETCPASDKQAPEAAGGKDAEPGRGVRDGSPGCPRLWCIDHCDRCGRGPDGTDGVELEGLHPEALLRCGVERAAGRVHRGEVRGELLMRTQTVAAAALLFACSLTACGSDEPAAPKSSVKASAPEHEVGRSDTSLNQSDWMEHCNTETSPESESPARDLAFGKAFTWPDGLEVTVVDAKVFSDWDAFDEPDPKAHEFRVRVKVDNKSRQAIDLDQLSVSVDGATNGGTADLRIFSKNSAPLEGRLSKGVSAVKTSDHPLEKQSGKDIVGTVQRTTDDDFLAFPEFTGTIRWVGRRGAERGTAGRRRRAGLRCGPGRGAG
ncbi:hypothetical protein AB0O74_27130 [Streptomyces rubiginosohelvolus]|uniref:hypothetical protein n=1 Tax=Streptomyces rubiginosohelvolus TaxID=67362 RepID=UPI0034199CC9